MIGAAMDIMLEETRRSLTPQPFAISTLTELKRLSYKTGLVSNCSPEVPQLWTETLLYPLIDAALFSCTEQIKKPDQRIYSLACDRLAVPPHACIYVADGVNGELKGATEVGMLGILYRPLKEADYHSFGLEVETWNGCAVNSLKDILSIASHKP
jgi:putative hydrolase of the HAD superfamily